MLKNSTGEKIKQEDPLLKSLLYCYHCQNKLQIINKNYTYKGNTKKKRYVIWSTTIKDKECYKKYINYDELENQILLKVSEVFEEYINSDDFNKEELIKNLINKKSNICQLEEKLKQISNRLNVIDKKINTIYNDKLNGIIEEEDYIIFYKELKDEKYKLLNLKSKTVNEIKSFNNMNLKEEITKILNRIVNDKEFKRDDLQQFIKNIEIDKEKNIFINLNFCKLNCLGG